MHEPLKKNLAEGIWVKISKLDAARRQIDTAIRLYFGRRDDVSIHTLGSAALGVIDSLLVKAGHPETMPLDNVRPEYLGEMRRLLHEDANFFKHADRDPESVLHFKPEMNEFVLVRCLGGYHLLSGERTEEMMIFQTWMTVWMPEVFFQDPASPIVQSARRTYERSTPGRFYMDMKRGFAANNAAP
jgi:hypothetical protein